MKLMPTAVAILTVLLLASCRPREQEPQEAQAHAPQPPDTAVATRTGVVQEVLQATAYTYLQVKEQDRLLWIAVTRRDMNVGDTVSFADGLEMRNFTSKDLQRTFETVYFVSQLRGGAQADHGAPAPMAHQGKPTTEKQELSIDRPEGGISIGELFANRGSYADKTIVVRGQVTKVNRAIMDRNWVHLQDGTSDSGNYDLTITTLEEVAPGEVVTFEGKIVLNKDFGSGYAYDVLLEDARRRNE